LFGGPTVDIQKYWRPIETAQRFSVAHPKSNYFMTGSLSVKKDKYCLHKNLSTVAYLQP
jgi:hypothetical protein